MAATRDEANRANAYVTSNKPLFAARKMERRYFADAHAPRDALLPGSEGSPASRIPRRTSPPKPAASIKGAYERVLREEEEGTGSVSGEAGEAGGSPSPAPRARALVGGSLREKDERRMNRLRDGISGTKRVVFGQNGGTAPSQVLEEDITTGTTGSGSGGSVSGSLTSLGEDATDDDLDRKVRQHARDQERAMAALKNQTSLFTRGSVGTRITETAHTLARKSSGSSMESEPGVRIPKSWGRKARPGSGWISRILSPDSSVGAEGKPPRAWSEESADCVGAAANVPLPSVEGNSSMQEPTPPHSRPSSAQPPNASSQKSQIWDAELDFTAQSLQISTSPQLKIRTSRLDDIRNREIESLSKRAVATSRLEEIRERNSEPRSVSPEAVRSTVKELPREAPSPQKGDLKVDSRSSSEAREAEGAAVKEAPTKITSLKESWEHIDAPGAEKRVADEAPIIPPPATSSGRPPLQDISREAETETPFEVPSPVVSNQQEYTYEKTILEEEGEAIRGTPITIFKSSAKAEKKDSQAGPKGDDSWDTLRKLAQVTSASPSPAAVRHLETGPDEPSKQLNGLSIDIKRLSTASTPPKSDVDPEERIAAEASLFALPDIKSELNSLRTPSPSENGNIDETPRPKTDPLSLPTPVVTGAYVDTPVPTGRHPRITRPASPPLDADDALHDDVSRLRIKDFIRGSSSRSSSKRDSIDDRPTKSNSSSSNPTGRPLKAKSRQRSRTPLINTAKPARVLDDLRQIQQEAQIEDSTLEDFNALLAAEGDDLDPNSTTIIEPPIELEKDGQGQPLSQKERERRQEMLAYERINKTIKSGLLNIRDAKRGIERLEDQVSSSPNPTGHIQGHQGCSKCESTDPIYHLVVPVPRLWSRDATKWYGIRFTWLGLILALFITWFVSETITCDYICHPLYATRNEWSPRDPFWGWALPTLADRLTGGVLKFSFKYSWRLLVWIWSSWIGVGVADLSPGARGGQAVKQPGMNWGPGSWSEGSMFEDETV